MYTNYIHKLFQTGRKYFNLITEQTEKQSLTLGIQVSCNSEQYAQQTEKGWERNITQVCKNASDC